MKDTLAVFAIVLLALLLLTACGGEVVEDETTVPQSTTETAVTQTTAAGTLSPPQGAAAPWGAVDLTAARGGFEVDSVITDADLVSPHGYMVGMAMDEAYLLWPFDSPGWVVDTDQFTAPADSHYWSVYVGNMRYLFYQRQEGTASSYGDYYLAEIYYGETIYAQDYYTAIGAPQQSGEGLCVLGDIRTGDTIETVLEKLPGNGKPRQWAIDQLRGQQGQSGSIDMTYSTQGGSYTVNIYTESCYVRLFFGFSGKLWIAEIMPQ